MFISASTITGTNTDGPGAYSLIMSLPVKRCTPPTGSASHTFLIPLKLYVQKLLMITFAGHFFNLLLTINTTPSSFLVHCSPIKA